MDNHYHLVVETPQANLSRGMRQLNGVYTQIFNRGHGRVGHLSFVAEGKCVKLWEKLESGVFLGSEGFVEKLKPRLE